ncbi:fibronectin type III domain-containing protein [Aeromicrobium sp. 179-A 4D2 NHS]
MQAVGVTSSTVTLSWPKYKGATKYKVERASNYAFTKGRKTVGARTNKVTVKGLRAGTEYCFKVRAYNRKGKHLATSARTCKPAAAIAVPKTGVNVTALTYNICSKACDKSADARKAGMKNWATRRPIVTRTILGSGADVVALQESSGWSTVTDDVRSIYSAVPDNGYYRTSSLLYRTSRFEQVIDTVTFPDPAAEGGVATETTTRAQTIDIGNGRKATWSELRDKRTGKHIIFVSAHVTPEKGAKFDARRKVETRNLIAKVNAVNTNKARVVYLGDFNSNKSRGYAQDTPARVMGASGYVDAYDQAKSLSRPNYNSGANGRLTPVKSYTYGDHVDKVWVRKGDRIGVVAWANIQPRRGSKYAGPMGSDHCPIRVTLRVA